MPAHDVVDRLELIGVPCLPERDRVPPIQNPAFGEGEKRLAELFPGKGLQLCGGGKILSAAIRLKFWIVLTQIIALERCAGSDLAGQQPPAQRAVAECRQVVDLRVGENLGLGRAFEEIVGRLERSKCRAFSEAFDLGNGAIARPGGADSSLLAKRFERRGRDFELHKLVGLMDLIAVDHVEPEQPQRALQLLPQARWR